MRQSNESAKTLKQRWKTVLKISWPLIIANSFWNLQLTIDRIFLSQYSTDSLAAAMAVMGIFWVPMALLQQTAAYSITFTAQYLGAGESKKIGPAIWQSIYLSIFGGLLLLGLIPFSAWFFDFVGHSPNVQKFEDEYFQALLFSALPTALVAGISGFYTGINKTRMVMWINGVGLVANVFLDYLFIFGNWGFPEMGIQGAGYATAGANLIGALFAAFFIFSKYHEDKYAMQSGWKWNFPLMKRFLNYGLPSGLQFALEGLAFTVFLIIIGKMPNGDAALAASSIAVTVLMLAILPPFGVAQAVSAKVGQYLGSDNPSSAENYVWTGIQICSVYVSILALSMIFIPEVYYMWFANSSEIEKWNAVVAIVPTLLIFVALFINFDSINIQLSFALKGAGDTKFVSLVALTVPWPVMVFPTWYTTTWENAIYWAWGAATLYIFCLALIFYLRFRQGRWKSMRVI